MKNRVDLGLGHSYHFVSSKDIEIIGIIFDHIKQNGEPCKAVVYFDLPGVEQLTDSHRWTVNSLDPLDLTPSLHHIGTIECPCGDHGYIHNGRWVPA